jgi:hypothetical protein
MKQQTRLLRRVCCTQLVLYLGRCNLPMVLGKRQHHGEPIPQKQVSPREVKPLPLLLGQTAPMRVQIFLPSLSFVVFLPW